VISAIDARQIRYYFFMLFRGDGSSFDRPATLSLHDRRRSRVAVRRAASGRQLPAGILADRWPTDALGLRSVSMRQPAPEYRLGGCLGAAVNPG